MNILIIFGILFFNYLEYVIEIVLKSILLKFTYFFFLVNIYLGIMRLIKAKLNKYY
jgi:hypothetical protein